MVLKIFSGFMLILFAGRCASLTMHCDETHLQYGGAQFSFDVSEYRSASATKKSLIILPPTGGTNILDRSYAEKFCAKGYDVFIINDWPRVGENTTDLQLHQIFYSNAQRAIKIVLEKIKTPFIGLLGTSVGALHASVAANSQPRINAAFFIVGGIPIAEVIATSDQKAMTDLGEIRKKRFGFKSDLEHSEAIDKVFSLEPQQLGDAHKSKDIGMVIASEDKTVPYKTQLQLKEFFKPRTVIELGNGHMWAIIKTWMFHKKEVVAFFEESSSKF